MPEYEMETVTGSERREKVKEAMDLEAYPAFRDFFRDETPYRPGRNLVMKQNYEDGRERYVVEFTFLTGEDNALAGIAVALEDGESGLDDSIDATIDHLHDKGNISKTEKLTYQDGSIQKSVIGGQEE